jgi:hypothetical protein
MAETPSVNQPASGTYGEQTELDKLKQSLPPGSVGQPPPAQPAAPPLPPMSPEPSVPTPQQTGRPPTGGPVPPGVPAAILGPTARPDVPVSTPLQPGPADPMAGVQTAQQARLSLLYMLSSSPDVSPTTRQWAQHVIDALTRG